MTFPSICLRRLAPGPVLEIGCGTGRVTMYQQVLIKYRNRGTEVKEDLGKLS